MSRGALAGLATIVALAGACDPRERYAESYEERAWRERSTTPWPEYDARVAMLTKELAQPGLPSWAGTFRGSNHSSCGEGARATEIALAPDNGIAWRGGNPLHPRRNFGRVIDVDGTWIRVAWEFPSERTVVRKHVRPEPELSDRLCLVPWGDREFLVPECDLGTFVNLVNRAPSGRTIVEPFAFRWTHDDALPAPGSWQLAEREETRPEVLPTLPEPWASRVRSAPLVARVLDVERPVLVSTSANHDQDTLSQVVQLDRGSADGVFVGMELYVERYARGAEVVACDDHASTCAIRYWRADVRRGTVPLAKGMELTSDRRP